MSGLYEFFSLKETFEVLHLPETHCNENDQLDGGPPEHSLVGAFRRLTEPLLTVLSDNSK